MLYKYCVISAVLMLGCPLSVYCRNEEDGNTIPTTMKTLKTFKRSNVYRTDYLCKLTQYNPLYLFYLNISLTTSGELLQYLSQDTIEEGCGNDSDSQWYLFQNIQTPNSSNALEMYFVLEHSSRRTPEGTCYWGIQGLPNDKCQQPDSEQTTAEHIENAVTTQTPVNVTSTVDPLPENNTCTCLCPCDCDATPPEKMITLMEEILEDMHLDKNSTSLAKRRLMSASDKRWISRGLGFIGITVITFVFSCIVIGDVKFFIRDTKTAFSHVSGRALHRFLRKKNKC